MSINQGNMDYSLEVAMKLSHFEFMEGKWFYTGSFLEKKVKIEQCFINEHHIVKQTIQFLFDTLHNVVPKKQFIFLESPSFGGGIYANGHIILSPVTKNIPRVIAHEVIHGLSDQGGGKCGFSDDNNIELEGLGINEGFTELYTQKVVNGLPQSLIYTGEENIKQYHKKIESSNSLLHKMIALLQKNKICSYDHYVLGNRRHSSDDFQDSYNQEVELAKRVIQYALKNGFSENSMWNAFFTGKREVLYTLFGAQKADFLFSLKNEKLASRGPERKQIIQTRNQLLKLFI